MKTRNSIFIKSILFLFIVVLGCSSPKNETYNRLMEHANSVKIIDTHEHLRFKPDFNLEKHNFWTLLNRYYLRADLISAGAMHMDNKTINSSSLDEMWELNAEYLNYTVGSSYYGYFLEGLKKCYGYEESTFTKEGVEILSEKIAEKYKDYESWFDECFHKFNFKTMFLDKAWDPHNPNVNKKYFSFVMRIDRLVSNIGTAKLIYTNTHQEILNLKESSGVESVQTLENYLQYAQALIFYGKENGAVALKNPQAYRRSIDYENITKERAILLFNKAPEVNEKEEKELQDFMFHWICDKAAEYDLPVQIHTGYLAGNGNQLDNGRPIKLNNLFLQHRETKFDLFHGGFPWTGEWVALGKMFPNVYLNLVWLPQISKQRAIITFNEMLDCVPYNKILWGGDCHLIEETIGSLEYGKQVVCEVLTERIENGELDEENAKKIISAVFRENAIKLFSLETK